MEFTAARVRRALAGIVVLCGSLGWPHAQPQMTYGVLPSISVPTQAHEADAAAAGPFVSLSLDEGTGTIAGDASGNGNTGTLLNGPTWVAGKMGGALRFDGADDALYIANSSTLNSATTGMTVAAWVYRETNQSGGVSVVSRQLGTTFYEHFYLGFESGKYRWFVNTTSGYSDTTLGGAAPLGQWIHLVGTYDGTDVKLYANGNLQFSTPHSGSLSADITGITIGAGHNDAGHTPGEAFNGRVDDVTIYGQALTAADVLQVYKASGGIADTQPSVSITAPGAGASVQGTFTATAGAADDVGVAGVQFFVDGVAAGPEDTAAPFTATVDTYRYAEGLHTLTAVARDTAGNTASSPASPVVFDNIAIMPLGDSLTYGFVNDGNADNEAGGYRRYLWEKLRADAITNVNFVGSLANGISTIDRDHEGHGGWRIDDIEAAVGGWLTASQPDIILLFAGANDIIQGYTPSLAVSRMGLLLDKIHTFRPTARVLVANLPGARANQDSTFSNVTPAAISAFNGGLAPLVSNRAALGWNVALVDAFGSAGLDRSAGSADYSIDGLHLSLAGYNKLASLWYSALDFSAADAAAPSVPSGLTATTVSPSQINVSWGPSTDNVGVTGYRVFRNGVVAATIAATAYQDIGLAPSTAYWYTVLAYDAANNQSAQSGAASSSTPSAAKLTSFHWDTTFPATYNVPITFTAAATATGGTPQYKFMLYSSTMGWRVGQDYSPNNVFTWFPPMGQNALQVWVRTSGSAADYEDWSATGIFTVGVMPAQLTTFSSTVPFPTAPTTTITWTAAVSGSAAEYKFWRLDVGAGTWSVLQDWSRNGQASWTPGLANSGWHALQVWVRAVGSTAVYEDWRGSDYFLVTGSTGISLTPSHSLTGLRVGEMVTWTANVAGAPGPWEYKFLTFDFRGWLLQQGYSAQNTFTWFPPVGTCTMQVWIRAAGSHATWERYESSGFFIVSP